MTEHRALPIAIRVWYKDLFTANAVHFLASAVRREKIRLSAFIELDVNNGNVQWGFVIPVPQKTFNLKSSVERLTQRHGARRAGKKGSKTMAF